MKKNHLRTLVLNADYLPLTIISWQRSIVLLLEDRVHQLDFYKNDAIKDGHGRQYPIPAVVALRKYVRREARTAPFCRKNVLIRDALVCQYCVTRFDPSELTFDHVVPRSKWKGQDSPTCWENIVTCCLWCNRRKGNKTCQEARMFPVKTPVKPAFGEIFLGLSPWKETVPPEWTPYLQSLSLFRGISNGQEAAVQ